MQASFMEWGGTRLVPFSPSDRNLIMSLHDETGIGTQWARPMDWFAGRIAELLETASKQDGDQGFAMWKIMSAGTEAFRGWAALVPFEETSEIAIDFRLSAEAAGADDQLPEQICAKLSEWFFDNTYFSHLISIVRTDNARMRNGLTAAGFRHRESKPVHGVPADIFQMLSPSMQSYVLTA